MRSRQDFLYNFSLILSKFGCHGNSLGSLENLDGIFVVAICTALPYKVQLWTSIFEIADPENPTIHAKTVSISCTEMKLWLFECLAYLYH